MFPVACGSGVPGAIGMLELMLPGALRGAFDPLWFAPFWGWLAAESLPEFVEGTVAELFMVLPAPG